VNKGRRRTIVLKKDGVKNVEIKTKQTTTRMMEKEEGGGKKARRRTKKKRRKLERSAVDVKIKRKKTATTTRRKLKKVITSHVCVQKLWKYNVGNLIQHNITLKLMRRT